MRQEKSIEIKRKEIFVKLIGTFIQK